MWQLIGERTNKVYNSSRYKSELLRWLNKKYSSERTSNSGQGIKAVSVGIILPEPLVIKKADQTAI